tara:strand:- start:213 stop:416 length:204 start_codon:yes stop_codon:yes gene_type:complete
MATNQVKKPDANPIGIATQSLPPSRTATASPQGMPMINPIQPMKVSTLQALTNILSLPQQLISTQFT